MVQKAVRLLEGERKVLSLEPTSLAGFWARSKRLAGWQGSQAAPRQWSAGSRNGSTVWPPSSEAPRRDRASSPWSGWTRPLSAATGSPRWCGLAGGLDGLGREGYHSTVASWEQVAAYNPEIVVLMPCGFHLDQNLQEAARTSFPEAWRRLDAVRSGRVYAVDGSSYFNRPGPRIVDGLEILAEIIHPELFPRTKPPEAWQRVEADVG